MYVCLSSCNFCVQRHFHYEILLDELHHSDIDNLRFVTVFLASVPAFSIVEHNALPLKYAPECIFLILMAL